MLTAWRLCEVTAPSAGLDQARHSSELVDNESDGVAPHPAAAASATRSLPSSLWGEGCFCLGNIQTPHRDVIKALMFGAEEADGHLSLVNRCEQYLSILLVLFGETCRKIGVICLFVSPHIAICHYSSALVAV